jgi:trk system potassium uptake protein TrkH
MTPLNLELTYNDCYIYMKKKTDNEKKKKRDSKRNSNFIAFKTFGLTILIGTLLLSLPISNMNGNWTPPLTALFTSTSATCVTGLIVRDTGSYFSSFGKFIIIALIQIGGLGIMTMGTIILTLIGRRLKLQDSDVVMNALGYDKFKGLKNLLKLTIYYTLFFEFCGALIIFLRLFFFYKIPIIEALTSSIFHSISAFCNAGFSTYQNSLISFQADYVIMFTMSALIIIGGLGFFVIASSLTTSGSHIKFRLRTKIPLHTKIVLFSTVILIAIGFLSFLAFEYNNALADLDGLKKIPCAFFQGVTPRTAGFNAVEMANLHPITKEITTMLMFIGGAPASTAGGIKITTIFIIILVVISIVRGREDTEIFQRKIPDTTIKKVLSIFFISITLVTIAFSLLVMLENNHNLPELSKEDLFFETISAFGTVGLSMGITQKLTVGSKLIIILLMFVGRLGPLTIALIVGTRSKPQIIHYAEENVIIG